MAKKIRFPLEMKNGIEVRTIEELKENFSLEKVLQYLENGKLTTWLRDRYLDDIAEALEGLNTEDSSFKKEVCDLFEVEYDENVEIDMEKAAELNRKLKLLKEFTIDKQFVDAIDKVAFDQDDLYDLLDEDEQIIYLFGERFSIPLGKMNIKYIGINEPVVVISAKEIVDFEAKGITFENCRFDEEYTQFLMDIKAIEDMDEDLRGQITPFVNIMRAHVDEFIEMIRKFGDSKRYNDMFEYRGVIYRASDYNVEYHDYATKAKAMIKFEEKQSAFDYMMRKYENGKDTHLNYVIDSLADIKGAFNLFIDFFLVSYCDVLEINCFGDAGEYVALKKDEFFSESDIKEDVSWINFQAKFSALEVENTRYVKPVSAKQLDVSEYIKAEQAFREAIINSYINEIIEFCEKLKNKLSRI